jgi:hypothetical protein
LISARGNGSLSIGVKEPWKVPFIFLFILIFTTFICAALDTLSAWGLSDSAARGFTLAYAVQHFPRSLFDVFVPSVVLSIVLLGLRLARQQLSRFIAFVLVLGISYLALVNGMLLTRPLASMPPAAEAPAQFISPERFVSIGERMVLVRSLSGSRARAVLVYDPAGTPARFTVAPGGTAAVRGGELTFTTDGPRPLTLSGSPDLSWTSVFAADRFTEALLRDVRVMSSDFQKLLSASRAEFFAASFALVFLCTASLMLLRITRWPLVNVMLLGIAVRGWFWLYHFLAVSAMPQLARAVTDTFVVRMAPTGAFLAIGVLFLLVDIIFLKGSPAGEPAA